MDRQTDRYIERHTGWYEGKPIRECVVTHHSRLCISLQMNLKTGREAKRDLNFRPWSLAGFKIIPFFVHEKNR